MAAKTSGQSGSVSIKALIIACVVILTVVIIMECKCPWPPCPPQGEYLKLISPPDVDKATYGHEDQPTCAYAVAANMLAAAGYGGTGLVHERAAKIYGDMTALGCNYLGTTSEMCSAEQMDFLLNWWLFYSGANDDLSNPYTDVNKYGLEGDCGLWRWQDGPTFIGDLLRECQFVGMSIVPEYSPGENCDTRHAITVWGDDRIESGAELVSTPTLLKVTDSDLDTGGDLQEYGVGSVVIAAIAGTDPTWSIAYPYWDGKDGYIRGFVTLSEVDNVVLDALPVYWVTSYRFSQPQAMAATGIRYQVATADGEEMMKWNATLDGPNGVVEMEMNHDHSELTVEWVFDDPVARGAEVTITTELAVPPNTGAFHGEPLWTYRGHRGEPAAPGIGWRRDSTRLRDDPWTVPNVTGGFVVGSLEIVRSDEDGLRATMARIPDEPVAQLRLLARYPYSDDPTRHDVFFWGEDGSMALARARFGHSYGYQAPLDLWRFGNWTADFWMIDGLPLDDRGGTAEIRWPELREYPRGEDYVRPGRPGVTPIGMIPTSTPTP